MNLDLSSAPLNLEVLVLHLCRGLPTIDQAIQVIFPTGESAWITSSGGWRCYPWAWMPIPELPPMPENQRDCFRPLAERRSEKVKVNVSLEDLGL